MAILSRVKISPQERYDLEDYIAEQAAARTDSKLYTQKFLSELNLVIGGFNVSGIGLSAATVGMTGAALIIPQNTTDFSYFVSAPVEPDVTIPDADLTDSTRNYLEVTLATKDGTPLTKAFWDSEANSGDGQEFNQIVNTVTDLKVSFVVSTGGFSGLPNRLPIAILDVDGSGIIKCIFDRRELYGRLAKPNDLDNSYTWGSRIDPVYSLNMTSVTGVFTAGEEITIGGETATVVSGGIASITFTAPTGTNFTNGSSVVGTNSGATGTVNTVSESFVGADKSLKGQKMINDALMTEFKTVKGTRFWYQDAPTLVGLKSEFQSLIAPMTPTARIKWTGSNIILTDDNLTPATSDVLASIRILSSTANLLLDRLDDGLEVVTIDLSAVPTSGTLTLDQDGNLIAIPRTASTSDIQTAWDASGAYPATIVGSPSEGRIVITANFIGDQVDVIESSNTFAKSGSPVVASYNIKQGMATDDSIAIADGEFLYIDLPNPLSDAEYSGQGSGPTNYKLATRGSASISDQSFWLAYREGTKLIFRGAGELQPGETSEISDNIPQSLLDSIGLSSETSAPIYSSNIRGSQGESIVKREGILTDAIGDAQEDRSGFLRSDGVVTWTGTEIQFASDIVLELLNTKSGVSSAHTIQALASPITIANGESIYVLIDRNLTSENVTIVKSSVTPIPAQTQATKDIFVLFKRVDALGAAFLHIPFHKQVLSSGQTVRLGASGSGSGSGSGLGDDLVSLLFRASFNDEFDENSGDAKSAVDASAGKTDPTTYSAAKALYQLNYDATKTVSAVGTAYTFSANPNYTVKAGDVIVIPGNDSPKRIVSVTNQTTGVLESAWTVDPVAAACCISQAVHTKDIYNLAIDGSSIAAAFGATTFGEILVDYEDTTTIGDDIYDVNTAPVIGYSASVNGSTFTPSYKRPTLDTDTWTSINLPSFGLALFLRFYAIKTSGSGTVNLLKYKTWLQKSIDEGSTGGVINSAYALTSGVGTPVNCTVGLLGGKTAITLNFTYPMGMFAGSSSSALEVHLNGQKIPRYLDATTTADASFTEATPNVILLDADYSISGLSVEVIRKNSLNNSITANLNQLSAINTHMFSNKLINSAFDFWQRGTSITVANAASTYLADRWYAKNSLGTNGVLTYSRVAGVNPGSKYGASVQITTAPTALQTNGCEFYTVLENQDSLDLIGQTISFGARIKALGNVNSVGVQFCYATTEIKPTLFFGTEQAVSVSTLGFTGAQLLAQNSGSLPTSTGVIGVRIRILGVSSGNTYDLNNGFVVEQAILNLGGAVSPFNRAGKNAQDELAMCQRYFETSYDAGVNPGTSTNNGMRVGFGSDNGNSKIMNVMSNMLVAKRSIPAVAYYDAAGTIARITVTTAPGADSNGIVASVGLVQAGMTSFVIRHVSTDAYFRFHFTADSEI